MLLVGVGLAAWCALALLVLAAVRPVLRVSSVADVRRDRRPRVAGLELVDGNAALGEEAACPACEKRVPDARPGWGCPECGATLLVLPRIGQRPSRRREAGRHHRARG